METFAILSHSELFRGESGWDQVEALLKGVSLSSLMKYASNFCHRLTYGDALQADTADFQRFQRWFLENFVPEPFRMRVLERLGHRRAYRGKTWALADPHHVANLVAAYVRANISAPRGEANDEDLTRLAQAQLMVNDLVSSSTAGSPDEMPETEVLRMFAMAQRADHQSTLPRAFDLFAERLPARRPDLEPRARERFGFGFAESLAILFGVFSLYLSALDPDEGRQEGWPRPNWSRGIIDLSALSGDHPGENAMRKVLQHYSADWEGVRQSLLKGESSAASINTFLRWPFFRLDENELWCFDPALILSAGTTGLLWLGAEAIPGDAVFTALGEVFESYIHDLFKQVGAREIRRGDREGQGFPDFFWMEDETLVVLEAKASVMRDSVKWSADPAEMKSELEKKILKKNQLPTAIERLLASQPRLAAGVRRIIPVFVVLNPCFASPGMEGIVNQALGLPKDGVPPVEAAHLLRVGELETAGNAIREGVFTQLLDARREVTGSSGAVSIGELLMKHVGAVRSRIGQAVTPHDALEGAKKRLNERMGELRGELEPGAAT